MHLLGVLLHKIGEFNDRGSRISEDPPDQCYEHGEYSRPSGIKAQNGTPLMSIVISPTRARTASKKGGYL